MLLVAFLHLILILNKVQLILPLSTKFLELAMFLNFSFIFLSTRGLMLLLPFVLKLKRDYGTPSMVVLLTSSIFSNRW